MAEMVTEVVAATAVVVIVNAGEEVAPAATVTVGGTLALGPLLDRVTVMPPAGAAPFRLTLAWPPESLEFSRCRGACR